MKKYWYQAYHLQESVLIVWYIQVAALKSSSIRKQTIHTVLSHIKEGLNCLPISYKNESVINIHIWLEGYLSKCLMNSEPYWFAIRRSSINDG